MTSVTASATMRAPAPAAAAAGADYVDALVDEAGSVVNVGAPITFTYATRVEAADLIALRYSDVAPNASYWGWLPALPATGTVILVFGNTWSNRLKRDCRGGYAATPGPGGLPMTALILADESGAVLFAGAVHFSDALLKSLTSLGQVIVADYGRRVGIDEIESRSRVTPDVLAAPGTVWTYSYVEIYIEGPVQWTRHGRLELAVDAISPVSPDTSTVTLTSRFHSVTPSPGVESWALPPWIELQVVDGAFELEIVEPAGTIMPPPEWRVLAVNRTASVPLGDFDGCTLYGRATGSQGDDVATICPEVGLVRLESCRGITYGNNSVAELMGVR
jgi:hypothetical protein